MGYGNWGGCCSSIINGYGGLGFVGPILTLVITAGIIIGVIVLVIRAVRRLSSRPNTIMNQSNQQKTYKPHWRFFKCVMLAGKSLGKSI